MTSLDMRVMSVTVQQRIVEKLRSAILEGLFKPGDKLVEADLCERLGVSRPSVREALRSLEAQRLIAIIPNRGPHIPELTWEEAADIYKIRALLEGEAAALAATNASAADLELLRAALAAFGKAVRTNDEAAKVSSTGDFYQVIIRLCGNRIIEEVLQGLLARINFLRRRSMSIRGRAKKSLEEMKAILEAIEAGDSDAAREAAVYHVEQARLMARQTYSQPD